MAGRQCSLAVPRMAQSPRRSCEHGEERAVAAALAGPDCAVLAVPRCLRHEIAGVLGCATCMGPLLLFPRTPLLRELVRRPHPKRAPDPPQPLAQAVSMP